MGTVAISSAELDDDELRRLTAWLRDEDELRGRVTPVNRPIEPGQMGGVLEAVEVVLTSGTIRAFVTSLFAWLGNRRSAARVSLKVRDDNGRQVELSCGSKDDAVEILDKLRGLLDRT